ncbi:DDAH1 (predicted) [Pycnogonum litorale]
MSVSSRHTNYTHAIVCKLSDSYATSCQNRSGVIDLSLAKSQFEAYVKALRDIGLDVIELPPDENFPDSVFVEDDAVICNGQALICRPGHPSRRGEVDFIRNIIKKELKLPIIEITDREATIDGGDVLFTGREFFVGISKRTNEAGARALASAFPDYPVTPIVITESFLHLKEVMTMGGADIFIVSEDKESQEILRVSIRFFIPTLPNLSS